MKPGDQLDEVVRRLEAERYGPIVRDPLSIPHIPLAAYGLDRLLDELGDDGEELKRTNRLLAQSAREGRKRRAARTLSVLTEEEASQAV